MRHTPSGFSLIEVVIAIGMIGLALALFQAMLTGSFASETANNTAIARGIAQSELESLRAGGYGSLPATGPFTASALSSLPGGNGALTVTSYNSGTKEVTVTVNWRNNEDATTSLSLATLVTSGGLP